MAIKFGKKQFNKPSPAKLERGIKIFAFVAGLISAWITTVAFIPHSVSDPISSILNLLISIAIGLAAFTGVVTTQTNVPIKDVTSMEEPKQP